VEPDAHRAEEACKVLDEVIQGSAFDTHGLGLRRRPGHRRRGRSRPGRAPLQSGHGRFGFGRDSRGKARHLSGVIAYP
jgi:hypothetical protein